MTARQVRALSGPALLDFYDVHNADRLPEPGVYDGRTCLISVWPVWRGKVFGALLSEYGGWTTSRKVINRIGPWWLVRGRMYFREIDQEVFIRYPFGLKDYLKPVSESVWLGYLGLGPWRIWFTLERQDR